MKNSNKNKQIKISNTATPKVKAKIAVSNVATNQTVLATVRSSSGKQHQVKDIGAFATRYNLDASNFRKVIKGQRPSCQGWSLAV